MVAIPVLTLVPGVSGGSEIYVRGLCAGLGRVGTHDYEVLAPPVARDAGGGLPTTVAEGYGGNRLLAMARGAVSPRYARLIGDADVVHYPLTVPIPRTGKPSVVTLHDVQHRDLPRLFSRAERAYRSLAYDRAARRADRVIVISEFVRDRAIEALGLDPELARVVPLGVDHDVLVPGRGPREPFLLYPARAWPHKNHETLFEAFALVRRTHPELRLVLTGDDFPSVPDGVEARGRVARAELVRLMQTASALVFPSLYEGFGLPPLEAMACGCPVACSGVAALPEVVGDAARLFDPRDAASIAGAVNDVLADPAPWIERGLVRAERFSWDETARATDAVYGELSSRS
ncbi:MAG TPA: glycosyltransferase family 1 protein [Gaiellaceae bacterium]|nr:glycosyltransferase family 1 protein [Gaiellaceae bacterium]